MLSAEVEPYAKVGGLADVVTALSNALELCGVDVKIITPLYRQVRAGTELRKVADLGEIEMAGSAHPTAVFVDAAQALPSNYFVEGDEFFDREGIYNRPETGEGYEDNFERFTFFQLAALEALLRIDWKPQVIHCHDSHTALVPAYLKLGRMGEPFFSEISTVLTIHNLAYQGDFSADKFRLTGLPEELFYRSGPFEHKGRLNLIKAGICYADILNTVSPHYAREILTEQYGSGLEKVLQQRRKDLHGILNGIDVVEWNPETDPLIFANFSSQNLQGKRTNKDRLQALLGFEVRDVPLIGMISRLVDQKGFDLLLKVREELMEMDRQWVLLGMGLKKYHDELEEWAQQRPDKFSVHLKYDNQLARQIEAGCDLFVMPSRYEPCGLNQMYSLRYGTVPVVRHTGGLADTIRDFDPRSGTGNGFKFYDYDSKELLKGICRAVKMWEDRELWEKLVHNAMVEDFSWSRSAALYLELFQQAVTHP